jgi:hypothetical protein
MNLPPPPDNARVAQRLIDVRLHLLDRQVLDRDGLPVTTVDDIALSDIPAGPLPDGSTPPTITGLLSGSFRFTRIFGGRPPMSRLDRIPWSDLAEIGTAIRLRVARDTLEVGWLERWVARHVIGKIPGGRHDPE